MEMQIGKTPVYLVKDNTSCTIIPEVPGLRELLSFVQKDLVPKPDLFFSNGKVYKFDAERNVWKLRNKEYLDSDGVPFDPVTQTAMQGTWKRGRGNEVVRKTVHAYNEIPNPSYKVLQTYQGLWRKVRDWLVQQGHPVTVHLDCTPIQPPQLNLMRGFRFSQQALTYELLIKDESGLLCAPTRFGKCLAPNTLVLMFDGSIKTAQDIRNGDLVMGQDSTSRKVIGCTSGSDIMYRVTPNKGEPFVVTQDHPLLLKRTFSGVRKIPRKTRGGMTRSPNLDGQEILVTPAEFEAASKTFRHLHKLVKRPVDFASSPVEIDPYCYGLWLGDGHTGAPALTTMDDECASAWQAEASRLGMRCRVTQSKEDSQASAYHLSNRPQGGKGLPQFDTTNKWRALLRESTPEGFKRVSRQYLINAKEVRLQVLAGLIDSDGWVNRGRAVGTPYSSGKAYSIIGKNEKFMWDVQFLARSLGFRATLHPKRKSVHARHSAIYYEVGITGAIDSIPVRLPRKKITGLKGRVNPLTTGFKVENIGEGPYCGFELEGPDKLFLLGDFTVTHNTTIIKNVLRAYPGVNTVVTVPGDDVLEQLYQDIKEAMPKRNVVKLGGSKSAKGPSDDITVCSMDSLHRCDHLHTRLLLIDEPHSAVTDSRMPEFQKFVNARKLGFGATLDGRFDGRDMLIEGVIGPVLANRTYREAVAEGAIAPIRVLTLKVPFKDFPVKTRQGAYNRLVFNNYELNSTINELLRQVVPQDMQALVFINNEKQAEGMLEVCGAPNVIAMAKKMTSAQRAELVDKMKTNQISRCIASNIFSTGVTFSDLAVVVMAAGGGGSISAIQKPGRIAEVRPGKKYGFVIDFLRQCTDPEAKGAETAWQMVIRDDQARLDTYRAKGYEVTVCEDIEELNKLFQQCL